ncbi:hypothetical protein OUZ56_028519 [Daphnia magna]|uniref:Uncharacterized protein n=1 Tax=Daphnia magna TaxID=35525 RepID=A0ABR0B489_9CRUS|nr:hypothetical protein OUZ56_028519 [Daphnia magna]
MDENPDSVADGCNALTSMRYQTCSARNKLEADLENLEVLQQYHLDFEAGFAVGTKHQMRFSCKSMPVIS